MCTYCEAEAAHQISILRKTMRGWKGFNNQPADRKCKISHAKKGKRSWCWPSSIIQWGLRDGALPVSGTGLQIASIKRCSLPQGSACLLKLWKSWSRWWDQTIQHTIVKKTKLGVPAWYAIILREATDASNKEQFNLWIRWVVDDDYNIHEDPPSLVCPPNTTEIAKLIKHSPKRSHLFSERLA